MSGDKVMLITGASRRIGASIARHAHDAGFSVVIHYRSSEREADALATELNKVRPDTATTLQSDFNDLSACAALIASAIAKWGRLDVLVNNASEFFPTPVGSITTENIDQLFRANVYAPLLLSQAAVPELKKYHGSIVNIVDIYASKVHPEHPVYCASKAALSMLTKSLAYECAPQVRVNGIAPGAILWPQGDSVVADSSKSALLEKIPLQRTGSAEQIAASVLYLCSDDASYITGQIITHDGGRTL